MERDLAARILLLGGVQIWNKRDRTTRRDVRYCGRPTGFGNPFEVGKHGTRDECCYKFEQWLETGEDFGNSAATSERRRWIIEHILELKGQDLECWCWPNRCHTETLANRANRSTPWIPLVPLVNQSARQVLDLL